MKIVGIMGSPRKGGNTEILSDAALKEPQKTRVLISKISLRDKAIAPCNGCLECVQIGQCVIEDDMQDIYKKILESEGII